MRVTVVAGNIGDELLVTMRLPIEYQRDLFADGGFRHTVLHQETSQAREAY
jgi:hypothetical protein